jgi:hypothetical protein
LLRFTPLPRAPLLGHTPIKIVSTGRQSADIKYRRTDKVILMLENVKKKKNCLFISILVYTKNCNGHFTQVSTKKLPTLRIKKEGNVL